MPAYASSQPESQPQPELQTHTQSEQQYAHTNRLIHETSPYLLAHAHNPVDWWPWSHEAFEEARKRKVPIFVSIGYSTCYWCHVMERESFENETIAAMMNKHFVCIKVDREERPDVDNIYMTATQIYTGRGGWPMSVFLEPEKLMPFWCGTYFPAEQQPGMNSMTFPQVLTGISQAWDTQREAVIKQAQAIAQSVRQQLAGQAAPVPIGQSQVEQAVDRLLGQFDSVNGGFGGAPKFPQTSFLWLLMDAREHARDQTLIGAIDHAITTTLNAMAIGGIRDHVGGGFHRYATDATWTVPHFEKMLYDQGLMTLTYARAASMYDDDEYRRVVRDTLSYVRTEMTSPEGGFYSAQDAEVNSHEGANYLWTTAQVKEALDEDDAAFAIRVYGLDNEPNFRDPHHPNDEPSFVLRLTARPEVLASQMNMSAQTLLMKLASVNRKLYDARMKRPQPARDDKVIAGWNGLMMAGFAAGAQLLDEPSYLDTAQRAAEFVLGSMSDAQGGLLRAWRNGKGSTAGVLDDYAMVIMGLLAVAQATEDHDMNKAQGLRGSAADLDERSKRYFADDTGRYYDTRADREDLFVRSQTTYDGAVPCGSSVMLGDLIELYETTKQDGYLDRAVALLSSLSSAIQRMPLSTSNSTRRLPDLMRLPGVTDRFSGVFAQSNLDETKQASAEEQPCPEHPNESPVEVYAQVDSIEISDDTPAKLTLQVRIATPYHVTAADPGTGDDGEDLGLFPFRVTVVGGSGIAVYADYPKGEQQGLAGQPFYAYTGTFELDIAVEKTAAITGKPRLALVYQACTDRECLMPATLELGVEVVIKDQ